MAKRSIHTMAQANDVSGLRQALRSGIDVDQLDEFNTTALQYSISDEHPAITELLLEHRSDVTIQDADGFTALHYCVEYKNLAIAAALLERDESVLHIASRHGNQPLWTAVFNSRGNYEFVELFLRYGADVNHANRVGKSPLSIAREMGDDALVGLLEQGHSG